MGSHVARKCIFTNTKVQFKQTKPRSNKTATQYTTHSHKSQLITNQTTSTLNLRAPTALSCDNGHVVSAATCLNPLKPSGHYMYRQWPLHVPPVVTICTASGHYMYRQWPLHVPPVVTICTASGQYMYRQWSLYVPPVVTTCTASSHYMYRTVVTICTASGHYMYRQWSLYVPPV